MPPLKIDFQGSRVTSDGGLILVRELDERLGFGELSAQHLTDSRPGKNTELLLGNLFRQSVYSRIADYEDRAGGGDWVAEQGWHQQNRADWGRGSERCFRNG